MSAKFKKFKKAQPGTSKTSIAKSDQKRQDVIDLREDGSNYLEWRNKLSEHFQSLDGIIGAFLIPRADGTFEYVQRMPGRTPAEWNTLSANNPELTATDIRKMRVNELERLDREQREDATTYLEWYAMVLQTLSERQKELLARAAAWPAVSQARRPLALMELVRTAVVFQTDGLADTAQQDILYQRWIDGCKQQHGESPDDYVRRAKTMWQCLIASNHPSRGSEAAAIRRVVHGLDSRKYPAYCAKVANDENAGVVNAYPPSFSAIPSAVLTYVDPHPTAITARAVPQRYAYRCTFCHADSHEEARCWKKHPEQKPTALRHKHDEDEDRKLSADTKECVATTAQPPVKKKGKRKSKSVTAFATEVRESNPLNSLWGFTAYPLCVSYATTMQPRHPRLVTIDTFANFSLRRISQFCEAYMNTIST